MPPSCTMVCTSMFINASSLLSLRWILTLRPARFLVYHKVPKKAILYTFAISGFLAFVNNSPIVDRALRLPELTAARTSYATKIRPSFKADNVRLETESIRAMAKIARFLNLSAASPIEHVMHIVSDIIQG